MEAPKVDVLLQDGSRVPLASFFANGPVALVFLRHLGCIFCREQIAEFKRHPDLNVALVAMATPAEAAAFAREVGSTHPIVCDPDRVLHEAFGLTRGTAAQMLNFRTITRGLKAMRAGHRQSRSIGDPFQLPGAFIVAPDGEVVWEYRGRNAADHPPSELIKEQLALAQERRLSPSR